MSYFYYYVSGSNNDIVSVQDNLWSWMSSGSLGPEPGFTGSFVSKSFEDYSIVWDEAKRCPFDTGSTPRYRYDGSTIQPKSNVQNIDYDSGSFDLNNDGTLTWK